MAVFLFIGFLFVGFLIGIGYLFYFVPKEFGYPKTGKYLTTIFGLLVSTIVLLSIFEDKLFTRDDAEELIEEQGISLADKFTLKENKSMSGIGDYYHIFIIEFSQRDKNNAILKIKDSDTFKTDSSLTESLFYQQQDRYFGPKVIQDYETKDSYIREFFQPSGQKGYAPTFRAC